MSAPVGPAARLASTGLIWAALMALVALLFPEQLADPYIRSDDYPAQLPDPDLYYFKTLTEGRWLNWVWMLRGWPTDPVALQWAYFGAWTLTAALVGVGISPGWRRLPLAALIALAFAATPQQAYIGLWFNTTLPTMLLLAAYAGVALLASARVTVWLLALVVPVLLMMHTAYPFLALAIAAGVSGRDADRGDLRRLVGIFVATLAAGLVAIYALNWLVHGHFGVLVLGWREPNPLDGIGALVENLRRAAGALAFALLGLAVKPSPITLAFLLLLVLAALVALRDAPRRAERVLAAFALILAVPAAHMVLTGVAWPYRVTAPVHAVAVILAGVALAHGRGVAWRGPALAFLVLTLLIAQVPWQALMRGRALVYQESTRALAAEIRAAAEAAPGAETDLVVVGQAHGIPGSEFLQFALGLRHRLEQLTGLDTHLCSPQAGDYVRPPTEAAPELLARLEALRRPEARVAEADAVACAAHGAAVAALPPWPRPGHVAAVAPGVIGLHLPERTRADTPP